MYLMSHFAAFAVCLVCILILKRGLEPVDYFLYNHEEICAVPRVKPSGRLGHSVLLAMLLHTFVQCGKILNTLVGT